MPCQQLRFELRSIREMLLQRSRYLRMQFRAPTLEQRVVRRVLYEGVLEQEAFFTPGLTPEDQFRIHQLRERLVEEISLDRGHQR